MSGPFKMKNSALNYSAKNGTPINYGSPAKDDPHTTTDAHKPHEETKEKEELNEWGETRE